MGPRGPRGPEDGDSTLFIADGGRGAVVALPSATASRHDVVWASCFCEEQVPVSNVVDSQMLHVRRTFCDASQAGVLKLAWLFEGKNCGCTRCACHCHALCHKCRITGSFFCRASKGLLFHVKVEQLWILKSR